MRISKALSETSNLLSMMVDNKVGLMSGLEFGESWS